MSDLKLMHGREMARIACAACEGCGECCRGMGDSILLDPFDIYHLTKGLGRSFEDLLEKEVDLALARGVILPHLSMKETKSGVPTTPRLPSMKETKSGVPTMPRLPSMKETKSGVPTMPRLPSMKETKSGVSTDAGEPRSLGENGYGEEGECVFLGGDGRCRIHDFRPGLCRLYPLGRQYHDGGFSYFVLPASCPGKNRSKVRISAYLEVPDFAAYEQYIQSWHDFLERLRKMLEKTEAEHFKETCMAVLKLFFFLPYEGGRDFYLQYRRRLKKAEILLLDEKG